VNGVGFAKRGDFFDPLQQSFVIRFHDDSVFCWELRLSKTSVKRCNLSPEGGEGKRKREKTGQKRNGEGFALGLHLRRRCVFVRLSPPISEKTEHE
jgi:hypothetical protein